MDKLSTQQTSALRQEAASRIEQAQANQSNWLHLARFGLTEIPEEVSSLTHLEIIDLSDNLLASLPPWIGNMPKLKSIVLVGNPLESLPEFSNLTIDGPTYLRCRNKVKSQNITVILDPDTSEKYESNLVETLSLDKGIRRLAIGKLTITIGEKHEKPSPTILTILDSLNKLESLEELSLRGMRLEFVPEGIRRLRNLKSLSFDALRLHQLPDWVGELNLEDLSAIDNNISALPGSIRNLKRLRFLRLSWNPLKEIPKAVFDLGSLKQLSLIDCPIRTIPAEILQLENLERLDFHNEILRTEAKIESPPNEVVAKGLQAIRNYWRQRADAGVDYLCEAKLIILGEPGAGKTSLARKIENSSYSLSDCEKSTEGIEVIRYQFPTVIRAMEEGKEKVLERQFEVNIWDFGGQEIYHATHQFFLTRRSVYILVCDDRKEDTDFSYWLRIVEMLSDSSPLLIVQNEKQDRKRDIKLSNLRAQFRNLRDAFAANLDTNRGLDQVIRAIKRELEALPHVGTGLPATWKRVREALERDTRDHIGLTDYLDICQKYEFTRREDKLQLSGYLHDLGICLHFQDDPILKNIVILKPSWGTDAVYRVLDDPGVIAARGQFARSELGRIWSEEKYAGMQDELLRLMMKFQLCYAIEGDQAFIAPQLLSSDQPSYPWNHAGGLIVRYEYRFLPKGMVTRVIVALHRLIAGGNLVWKTGVVLERGDNRAEIVEEYSERRIRVRVSGPDPRGLLAIVDEQLERLHSAYPGLEYERFLPCPCSECKSKAEPCGFALKQLANMAKKHQNIQCHDSGEMVDPAQLLAEILPGAVTRARYGVEFSLSATTTEVLSQATPLEVFVSYAWNDESCAIVDELQQALSGQGVRLMRDREEVRYKDSIRDFMRRIGKGKCVVVVISEKYLKSENCMFELVEIAKAGGLRERILPIVLSDANVYKAIGRVRYVKHWEHEVSELDEALKTVRGDNLTKLQEDLNVYAEIRRLFDGITDTLRDMNALTPDQHKGSDFEEVIRRIRAQLGF